MDPLRATPAEETAALLEDGTQRGVPVLIPGANEVRPRNPAIQPTAPPSVPTPLVPRSIPPDGRAQLENEREGGGAPNQRRRPSRKTFVATLKQWLFLLLTFAVFPPLVNRGATHSPADHGRPVPEARRCSD